MYLCLVLESTNLGGLWFSSDTVIVDDDDDVGVAVAVAVVFVVFVVAVVVDVFGVPI